MELFFKNLAVVFVILCFSFSAKTETEYGLFPCGYDYETDAGWFKMHEETATWWAANQICGNEGAELASPFNDALKDAMMTQMYKEEVINNEVLGVSTVHTGLKITGDLRNEAEFQDLQGETLALTDRGQIQRVNENTMLPFICYKNASQDLNLNECGTIDLEYSRNKQTNKCYKFHRNRENWYAAAVACLTEGGQLAIIRSEDEAQAIRELFEQNPPDIIPGYDWKDSAFVGYFGDLKSEQSDMTWLTVEEQSLSQAGYEGWSPGEPNNASGNEYCVSAGRNGKLFDDPCFRQLPFICEKRTDNCVHRNYYKLLQFKNTNVFAQTNFYNSK